MRYWTNEKDKTTGRKRKTVGYSSY